MHKIPLTRVPGGFSQNSFPDAVKRLKLSGYEAQHFADMALHLEDLTFSALCFSRLVQGEKDPLLRDSLWMSGLISFYKCFGKGHRVKLLSKDVYSNKPGAEEVYVYYKAIRDGRIAHDANALTKAMPFAYLNRFGVTPKIAAVTATMVTTGTDDNDHRAMLALTQDAMWWCNLTANRLRSELMRHFESLPYEELQKFEESNELPNTGEYKNAFKGRQATGGMKPVKAEK